MRKPSSTSKNVIAVLVAAAFGLTAGTALAQTTPQSSQSSAATSHRHASKKSVRQHQMKQARSKEMRVANAGHRVKKREHSQRSRVHIRKTHPANTTPPPR
jgi:hypothetical protein